jgi:hypothetical protein
MLVFYRLCLLLMHELRFVSFGSTFTRVRRALSFTMPAPTLPLKNSGTKLVLYILVLSKFRRKHISPSAKSRNITNRLKKLLTPYTTSSPKQPIKKRFCRWLSKPLTILLDLTAMCPLCLCLKHTPAFLLIYHLRPLSRNVLKLSARLWQRSASSQPHGT